MYILNKNQIKMPINTKCGYCKLKGHTIDNCNSEEGIQTCNYIKSRGIDFFTSNQPINHRANNYYKEIQRDCNVQELRFILAKVGCSTTGTKSELAARFIHEYFFRSIALRQLSHLLSINDRLHIGEYMNYWLNISRGVSTNEANRQMNEYFEFILNIDMMQIDNTNFHQYDNSVPKFPIKVFMELIDLTDENEKPSTFECAICMEDECSILDKVDIGCNHSFCKQCVTNVILDSQAKRKHPCCALCRSEYNTMHVRMHNVLEEFNEKFCLL